jgi:quinoprotein glucose dehydrogenase
MRINAARMLRTVALIALAVLLSAGSSAQSDEKIDWPTYGNDPGGSRYSAAAQINRTDINELKVAWTYRTGANDTPTKLIRKAAFEATPILVDGKLFLSIPYNHVIALEPGTGAKLWEYDPGGKASSIWSFVQEATANWAPNKVTT